MNPFVSVALTLMRLTIVVLAGRQLLRAIVLPRGRRRERSLWIGVALVIASLVRV